MIRQFRRRNAQTIPTEIAVKAGCLGFIVVILPQMLLENEDQSTRLELSDLLLRLFALLMSASVGATFSFFIPNQERSHSFQKGFEIGFLLGAGVYFSQLLASNTELPSNNPMTMS